MLLFCPNLLIFRIHCIQNGLLFEQEISNFIANENQLLNIRQSKSKNVFIVFVCNQVNCFQINVNIVSSFLLFQFFISNDYFEHQLLISLIPFQNPITEIKLCSKMVAEINIQSDERMLIDTRNAIFILPRCRSRCSRVTCRHRGGGLGSSSSPGATVLSRVWSDYRSMRLFMTCNCRSTV